MILNKAFSILLILVGFLLVALFDRRDFTAADYVGLSVLLLASYLFWVEK